MKTKKLFANLLVLIFSAVLVWAGEPWEEKPWRDWTRKDLEEISINSPWAKQVRIYSGQVQLGPGRTPSTQSSGPTPSIPSMGGGSGSGGDFGSDRGARTPRQFFIVQWASSLTIRQSMVRHAELQQGEVNEQAVENFLENTPSHIIIFVSGPDMRGFEEWPEEKVKQSAYLELDKSDRKLPAENVIFEKQEDRLVNVQFFFPRSKDGNPLIAPEEKKVKFFCEMNTAEISTSFDLRKMVRNGELDI